MNATATVVLLFGFVVFVANSMGISWAASAPDDE